MFALDRCGMGEILDCLKKIKLDIPSLKSRVENCLTTRLGPSKKLRWRKGKMIK